MKNSKRFLRSKNRFIFLLIITSLFFESCNLLSQSADDHFYISKDYEGYIVVLYKDYENKKYNITPRIYQVDTSGLVATEIPYKNSSYHEISAFEYTGSSRKNINLGNEIKYGSKLQLCDTCSPSTSKDFEGKQIFFLDGLKYSNMEDFTKVEFCHEIYFIASSETIKNNGEKQIYSLVRKVNNYFSNKSPTFNKKLNFIPFNDLESQKEVKEMILKANKELRSPTVP